MGMDSGIDGVEAGMTAVAGRDFATVKIPELSLPTLS